MGRSPWGSRGRVASGRARIAGEAREKQTRNTKHARGTFHSERTFGLVYSRIVGYASRTRDAIDSSTTRESSS